MFVNLYLISTCVCTNMYVVYVYDEWMIDLRTGGSIGGVWIVHIIDGCALCICVMYVYECACGTGVYVMCVFIRIWRKGSVDVGEGKDGVFCFYIYIWRKGPVDTGEGEESVSIY